MPSKNATDYTDDNLQRKLEEATMHSVNKIGKCNILIMGKTGVGKSTLINTIFKEYSAKTGAGRRITESIKKYEKEGSLVTVYDTPGLQLFSGEEIANIRNELSQLIEKEPIHVVWYCINAESNRFEETEEDWIRDMDRQKVPIILLLTKALRDNDSEFLKYFKKQELPVIDIIPVMAQPRQITSEFTVPASGLDNLVEVTASTLPEVQRNAFYREQNIIPIPYPKPLPSPTVGKELLPIESELGKPGIFVIGALIAVGVGIVVGIGIVIVKFFDNKQEDTKNSDKEQEDTKNIVDHEGSDDER
jgi:small GTP-binding protein